MPSPIVDELDNCPLCGGLCFRHGETEFEALTSEECDGVITELRERVSTLERENAGLRAELQRPLPGFEA